MAGTPACDQGLTYLEDFVVGRVLHVPELVGTKKRQRKQVGQEVERQRCVASGLPAGSKTVDLPWMVTYGRFRQFTGT